MSAIAVTVEFPASPAQVWAVLADPTRLADWLTLHRSWVGDVPVDFAVGTQAAAVIAVMGLPLRILWTVAGHDPPRTLTLNGTAVGAVEVAIELELAGDAGHSTLQVRVRVAGALVTGAIGAAVEAAARAELDQSGLALQQLVAADRP